MWDFYTKGKQTYAQLALFYNCSVKTIQRKIDIVKLELKPNFEPIITAMLDATFFKRKFGVLCIKDNITKKFVYKKYIQSETLLEYNLALDDLKKRGILVQAAICDGRRGVIKLLKALNIPVQICIFHQQQIITRYLTKNPKLEANKELKIVSKTLKGSSIEDFEDALKNWHNKWKNFINERTEKKPGKRSHYIHRKTRAAYKSLINNLPYLFEYQKYPELLIPNTTNGLDGVFSDMKNKIRNHNGLSEKRKRKLIDAYFGI